MVRVVKDLRNNHIVTTNARKAVDTYARPYYHVHNSLASVADALEKWNPVFVNVARKKEQERYNREVEEGKAIAMQYAGRDFTLDQIENDIKSGNSDRYRKLSFAMKEGINQMQMEQGLNSVSMKMFEAYDDATFPDANGNPHRLYEAKDPMAFQKWFDGKFNELWEAETGGKYDQSLYGELGSKVRATVQNSLYNQFLRARGEMKQYEADKAMVGVLDTYLTPLMDRGKFVGNSKALGDIRATIDRLITQRDLAGGAGDGDRVATNVLLMKMGEADTQLEVNFLADAARGSKLWNNAQYRSKIETFVKQKEKQFQAEREHAEDRAYTRFRHHIGYITGQEQLRALNGAKFGQNIVAEELKKVGNTYERMREVLPDIMARVGSNRYAAAEVMQIYRTSGQNISRKMQMISEASGGKDVDEWGAVSRGEISPADAMEILQTKQHSNYKAAAALRPVISKMIQIEKPDAMLGSAVEKSNYNMAVDLATTQVINNLMSQGINDVNSPDFFVASAELVSQANQRFATLGQQAAAAQVYKTQYYGEIAKGVSTPDDAKNFFAYTDILKDPDFKKSVGIILNSRGVDMPMASHDTDMQEKKLKEKGYTFRGKPVNTFNDVQFIANEYWNAVDLNTTVTQLKGNN